MPDAPAPQPHVAQDAPEPATVGDRMPESADGRSGANLTDRIAEAICSATSAGALFPWATLSERERDPWRRMACAAFGALGLTQQWGATTNDDSRVPHVPYFQPCEHRSDAEDDASYLEDGYVVSRWATGWERA